MSLNNNSHSCWHFLPIGQSYLHQVNKVASDVCRYQPGAGGAEGGLQVDTQEAYDGAHNHGVRQAQGVGERGDPLGLAQAYRQGEPEEEGS